MFGTSLKLSDLKRLEQIQYKAGKLVSGALHLSSTEKLNQELGWESIKTRVDLLGLSLFHKVALGETRPLLRSCLTNRIMRLSCRQVGNFTQYPNYGAKFQNSFFPYFVKKWNNLERPIRTLEISEFKQTLKEKLKPKLARHYSYGGRLGNKLLTRLRLGRSFLNSHGYAIGKTASPSCQCHHNNETT